MAIKSQLNLTLSLEVPVLPCSMEMGPSLAFIVAAFKIFTVIRSTRVTDFSTMR